MATLEFCDKHNMVAYLEKTEGNGQAKTITKASLRRHLKLEDNGGITSLPNIEIFEQLALMGYATDSDKRTFQKVKRVKKLEKQVKTGKARRRTKIVLSEDKTVEEDSSKQGRSLIEELYMDADISLVPPHAEIQEKASDETEVLLEEEEATEIVSTATESLVYIRRSAKKKKDKGKAIMIEDESVQKKDDLDKLWSLVRERYNSSGLAEDKKIELWVELKMLFEPDAKKILELQKDMHDPLNWTIHSQKDLQLRGGLLGFRASTLSTADMLTEEDIRKLLEIVSVKEFRIEAMQTKEDLDTLWSLVKEKFISVEPTEDMERAL
ncbi:hypothetical protein Tco_1167871 [Tanacetum coccineum]